jgi:hypothetical protein
LAIGLDQHGSQPKKNEQATNIAKSGDDDAGRHVVALLMAWSWQGEFGVTTSSVAAVKF